MNIAFVSVSVVLKVLRLQKDLIPIYENDFSKRNGKINSGRILMVFRSIPSQRYYSVKNSKIDFVIQKGTEIIPVEVKAGEDKSAPAFKKYIDTRNPEHAIRFSQRGYLKNDNITNIPLYLVGKLNDLIE